MIGPAAQAVPVSGTIVPDTGTKVADRPCAAIEALPLIEG